MLFGLGFMQVACTQGNLPSAPQASQSPVVTPVATPVPTLSPTPVPMVNVAFYIIVNGNVGSAVVSYTAGGVTVANTVNPTGTLQSVASFDVPTGTMVSGQLSFTSGPSGGDEMYMYVNGVPFAQGGGTFGSGPVVTKINPQQVS